MTRHGTSIRLSDTAASALAYLRGHPEGFVLGREVQLIIIREAMKRGWKRQANKTTG